MHDLYLFRTFYGAYQTFVNGYYVSATAYDQYATTQEQAVQDFHTLDDSLFLSDTNRHPADGLMLIISKEILTKDWHTVLCRYLLTVLHTIVISWPFITNVATVLYRLLITWCEPILSSDSLLGIKYILGDFTQSGYEKVNDTGYNNKNIYKNPYALELGYKTSDDISSEIHADNILEYQNALLSRIVGHLVQCYKTCTAEKTKNNDGYSWTVTSPEQDSVLYGYCNYTSGNDLKLYIDGNLRTEYSIWSAYKTFQVGDGNTPAHIVQLKGTLQRSREIDGVFYYLDMQEFRDVMREISQNQVTTFDLQDKYIKCEYTAQSDELLLLTIPYDDGWTAYVNGEKVEAYKLQDIFTGIRVTSGINTIEMKYTLPEFKIGVIFSCLGVIVYSLTCFFLFKKQRHF
ncbi:MAG: YfhO family protein [Blautia sp.]